MLQVRMMRIIKPSSVAMFCYAEFRGYLSDIKVFL
jgi:hypothetical protein